MKRRLTLLLTLLAASTTALWVEAGSWDNLKLKYFHLTSLMHDQKMELADLDRRGYDPNRYRRISLELLEDGGPPKDGIPSLDEPAFIARAASPYADDDRVIGLEINGEAKAYPLGILNWHEIVNDRVGGVNVTVSYCPLCDTAIVFDRGETTFGVSGKLYQSCLVMYDRADDSLYAQPWALGVVGPAVDRSLARRPAVITTLGGWLKRHPESVVLSSDTGYRRDYQRYPYGSYRGDENIYFAVRGQQRLDRHPKAAVSYLWEPDGVTPTDHFSGLAVAFLHEEVKRLGSHQVQVGERTLRARWDEVLETVVVEENGVVVPTSPAFAFVFFAFFGGG